MSYDYLTTDVRFHTDNVLLLAPLDNGKDWMVVKDYECEGIIIPAGFVTNFTSVPRPMYKLIPPWGTYGVGSIVHDYLYSSKKVSRKEADRLFYKIMKKRGTDWFTRNIIYLGVKLFGWIVWRFKEYS